MNKLKEWMHLASPSDLETLADLADTTPGALRQLAGGYKTDGKPRASAEMARRIEQASENMHPRLPIIHREDLCPACAGCEFAKAYRK